MKKMIGRLLLLSSFFLVSHSYLNASDNFENMRVEGDVVKKNARNAAKEYISSNKKINKGKGTLKDGRSYFTSIGTSPINARPDDRRWGSARLIAFERALLDSMRQCVEFQEVEISSTMQSFFEEKSELREKQEVDRLVKEGYRANEVANVVTAVKDEGLVKKSPTLQALATSGENILRDNIQRELSNRKIDPSKPVSQENLKKIIDESSFKNSIRTAAYGKCKGIKRLASFEGKEDVAVVTIWTERLSRLASALVANDFRPFMDQRPGNSVQHFAKLSDKEKLASYGTDLLRDETGSYFLLTYAQANPASEKSRSIDIAYKKAETTAKGLLRQFLGMQVMVETDMQQGENVTSYSDGSEDNLSDDSFLQAVNAVGSKISIQGIETIGEWELTHPWSGRTTVGVITVWRPSGALFARNMKRAMEKPYTPRENPSQKKTTVNTSNEGKSRSVENYDGKGASQGESEYDF